MSEWTQTAKALDGALVEVEFTKMKGRVRRETGRLEYQPEKARIRIDKGEKGFRLVTLGAVVSIKQSESSVTD